LFAVNLRSLVSRGHPLDPATGSRVGAELVDAVLRSVASGAEVSEVEAHWRDLGAQRASRGFPDDGYPAVGRALVRTVRDVSGDAWTSSLSSGWSALHLWMVGQLCAGAGRARSAGQVWQPFPELAPSRRNGHQATPDRPATAAEYRAAEYRAAEYRAAEHRAAEHRATEQWAAEHRATEPPTAEHPRVDEWEALQPAVDRPAPQGLPADAPVPDDTNPQQEDAPIRGRRSKEGKKPGSKRAAARMADVWASNDANAAMARGGAPDAVGDLLKHRLGR
jgi:hypothetical protein